MISRTITALLITAGPFLFVSCMTPAIDDHAAEVYEQTGPAKTIAVTGEIADLCKEILGRPYPSKSIQYWNNESTSIWVLNTKGKHGLITSQFAIKDEQITNCRVIASKEVRRRKTSSRRFLRQFQGMRLKESGNPNKRIDAITGATISSEALEKAGILALRLNSIYAEKSHNI